MALQHVEDSTLSDSPAKRIAHEHDSGHRASAAALVLGALGVVFGDIGTSPSTRSRNVCMPRAARTRALRICSGSSR